MDFSTLNTKSGAAKGAFLHLKHPALGHKLYTGEGADQDGIMVDKAKVSPVGCHVMGLESERVRERAKAIQKSRLEGDEEENGLEFICSLVTELVGFTDKDGKPLQTTDENKRKLFEQSDGLVEQVLSFARERANFFKRT